MKLRRMRRRLGWEMQQVLSLQFRYVELSLARWKDIELY
jgi:hypothetical protein